MQDKYTQHRTHQPPPNHTRPDALHGTGRHSSSPIRDGQTIELSGKLWIVIRRGSLITPALPDRAQPLFKQNHRGTLLLESVRGTAGRSLCTAHLHDVGRW